MYNVPFNRFMVDFHFKNLMVFYVNIYQEIVPLRKVCRRPETDYRLQQLHAVNDAATASAEQLKSSMDSFTISGLRPITPAETMQKQQNVESAPPPMITVLHSNVSLASQAQVMEPKKAETGTVINLVNSNIPLATATITNSTITTSVPGGTTENMSEWR